jgi:hypothetical protein
VTVLVGVDVFVGVFVEIGVTGNDFVKVIDGVTVLVTDGVTVFVGVCVKVLVGVGVAVGVTVSVGVIVFVGVFVGVGVGKIVYVKSSSKHVILQLGQSGLNKLNFVFSNSKLCFTSGADKGETYILNCEIPPSKVPAKLGSIKMFVVSDDNEVALKTLLGNNSGS